jgi:hypothetical protein
MASQSFSPRVSAVFPQSEQPVSSLSTSDSDYFGILASNSRILLEVRVP